MTGNKFNLSPRFLAELIRKERVAIVGSAGVGKTTLLNELFEHEIISTDFKKIPELVRELCAKKGYESPYKIPAEEEHAFREELLDLQIKEEEETGKFIADRGCLDAWLYFVRWSWNSLDVEDAERFFQKAFAQTKKYDAVIYLPITFEIEDDGFRWANKTYQRQMDRMFRESFRAWDLDLLFLS